MKTVYINPFNYRKEFDDEIAKLGENGGIIHIQPSMVFFRKTGKNYYERIMNKLKIDIVIYYTKYYIKYILFKYGFIK